MMWVAAMYNVLAILSMTVFKVFCYNNSRKHPRRVYFWKQTTSICTALWEVTYVVMLSGVSLWLQFVN